MNYKNADEFEPVVRVSNVDDFDKVIMKFDWETYQWERDEENKMQIKERVVELKRVEEEQSEILGYGLDDDPLFSFVKEEKRELTKRDWWSVACALLLVIWVIPFVCGKRIIYIPDLGIKKSVKNLLKAMGEHCANAWKMLKESLKSKRQKRIEEYGYDPEDLV